MIFHQLLKEAILQVNDPTRLSAEQTFVSPDEGDIIKVEISPNNGSDYFDVTNADNEKWYLDWAYDLDGDKIIKVRISTTLSTNIEKDFILKVISEEDDFLFSSDNDLLTKEPEIYCYLKKGRKSFLDVHRCAQKHIMDWLEMQIPVRGCYQNNNDDGCVPRKINKKDLHDKEEVRLWSIYKTLAIIFEGLGNQVDDVFRQKSVTYNEIASEWRARSEVTIDINQDGKADYREHLRTTRITRKGP